MRDNILSHYYIYFYIYRIYSEIIDSHITFITSIRVIKDLVSVSKEHR